MSPNTHRLPMPLRRPMSRAARAAMSAAECCRTLGAAMLAASILRPPVPECQCDNGDEQQALHDLAEVSDAVFRVLRCFLPLPISLSTTTH